MPPVELAADLEPAGKAASIDHRSVSGWGGGVRVPVTVVRAETVDRLREAVSTSPAAIARGMGRSYGDAAQLGHGIVLDMTGLRAFELDAANGVVIAQGGATLGALLKFLAPAGWILPVVPGTQHVTVGGAIASDVHGKNHASAGTFGSHVLELGLLTAAGDLLSLSAHEDAELFRATIGGMGLTGVILWARIKLRRLSTASLAVDTDRVETLEDALAILDGPGGTHRVAWLDLLSRRLVRGVVTRADHLVPEPARDEGHAQTTVSARLTIPSWWPGRALAPSAIRAFNELRFRRTPQRERAHIESFGSHMFPLDVLDAWPRLYGSPGFLQYQLVVPRGQESTLNELLVRLRRSQVPCYLAVLKDFGAENDAPLSFPLAGWTLALDMPQAAPGLESLLSGFDELVAGVGGRVYLAKDRRLRPEVLEAMYPRLTQWRTVRDRADPDRRWRSDLGLRTGLVESDEPPSHKTTTRQALTVPTRAPTRVLLVGGSSEIGLAIVRRLQADGAVSVVLLGRDGERLEAAASQLRRSDVDPVAVEVVDADDLAGHERAVASAFDRERGIDVVVVAVGVLGAQAGLDADPAEAEEIMRVNFLGAGSLLLHCLRRLRAQGSGTMIVLSSVAAERPRASNAIYGAAKAGLDALAQGLADATAASGVRVLTVRPGFVSTRMTEGLKPAPFATTPEAVADATVKALAGSAHTVWVPSRLRWIFALLRHMPRALFRRLPL